MVRSLVSISRNVRPRSQPTWPFIGQEALGSRLLTALQSNQLPPAILFLGPAELGKRSAAEWLAKVDLCQTPGRRPCGTCPACRQIERQAHPFVHQFVGTAAEPIQIEAIRELVTSSRLRLPTGQHVWLILSEVEWLTESAANALLKFLEEPPAGVQAVLTSSQPDRILPTIRSRCAIYYWHFVPAEKFQVFGVARTSPNQSAARIARAAGRPGKFKQLVDAPDGLETELQGVQQFLAALDSQSPDEIMPLIDQAADEPIETFNRWGLALRELLLYQLGVASRRLWPALDPSLARIAKGWPVSQVISRLEHVQTSSLLLERHVAPKHIAVELLLV